MTTAGGAPLPKYLRVAAAIRRQIADGSLRPGQPAPSGAELSRAFGFSTLTCRKALRALIAEGLLVPGPSSNARPRVADPQAPGLERDLADAARALSEQYGHAAAPRPFVLLRMRTGRMAGERPASEARKAAGQALRGRSFRRGLTGPAPGGPDAQPGGGGGQGRPNNAIAGGPQSEGRWAKRPDVLREWIRATFVLVQRCWQERDYGPVRDRLEEEELARHEGLLRAMRGNAEINRIDNLSVRRLELVHVAYSQEGGLAEVTALITFEAVVYFIAEALGGVLARAVKSLPYQEFWTFRRNAEAWRCKRLTRARKRGDWRRPIASRAWPTWTSGTPKMGSSSCELRWWPACAERQRIRVVQAESPWTGMVESAHT